jgi:hypothetical protein
MRSDEAQYQQEQEQQWLRHIKASAELKLTLEESRNVTTQNTTETKRTERSDQ